MIRLTHGCLNQSELAAHQGNERIEMPTATTPDKDIPGNESQTVRTVRKKLGSWLDRAGWKKSKLLDWLKGYELPAIGHEEEPYVWLLRVLSNSDRLHRQEMARRLADLLDNEKLHEQLAENYDEDILYNVLSLSAGLQCREELAEPLYRVFDYFQKNTQKRSRFLNSKRYNLSGALRDAIVANQIDNRFQPVWQQILSGQPHYLLRGNRHSGVEGLIYMPQSASEPRTPALDQIGFALAEISKYLQTQARRHYTFRRLLERVKEAWPDSQRWDEDLLLQACKHGWPTWAVLRLDTLVVPLEKWTDEMQHYLIWEFYLPYLQHYKEESLQLVGFRFDQIIAEVLLGEKTTGLLNSIRLHVEDARRNSPDTDYRGIKLSTDEALKNLREQWLFLAEEWGEVVKKDSIFNQLCVGRIETLAAEQPEEKQDEVRRTLTAAAAAT
jgi:hypothetical protein